MLEKLYGKPEFLIHSLLRKLRDVPAPKVENLQSIVGYGLAVQNLVDHMVLAEQRAHLQNPMLLQEMVAKLPASLKMQWGVFKRDLEAVDLASFNDFMSDLVSLAADLSFDCEATQYSGRQSAAKPKPREKLFVHSQNPSATESDSRGCACCNDTGHFIRSCPKFLEMNVAGRWKAVKHKELCRTCLIPHRRWPCRSTKECGVDGCRIRHDKLLHGGHSAIDSNNQVVHHNHHNFSSRSLFRYLPVTVYGNGTQVNIYAFLDDGSSATLLEEGVAKRLGLSGETESLWLSWTGKLGRQEKDSKRVCVRVAGVESHERHTLRNVRTVRELSLPSQTLDYVGLCQVFPHLQGLPVDGYRDARPSMIIGLEHARMLTSLKVREGAPSDPVAAKTRLGWCIFGRSSGTHAVDEQLNRHGCERMSNVDLHKAMRKFFAIEEAAVSKRMESEAEKRAIGILERTTVRIGNKYETGLLWNTDEVIFPKSFPMAISRLNHLERRLSRDPTLKEKVQEQIRSYEEKGYVRKVSQPELEKAGLHRVWYLPLSVVLNPKKPGKVRVVWDAAAKVSGVSFNDMLLKGPDMLVSLSGVLLRFRQRRVAVCSDIREMFLRISIREEDRLSQCFVWRNQQHDEVQVYVINVAMFGATCSPCIAQYIKNKNAREFIEEYPRAVEAVIHNHYVDDFLDSVDTEEEAVELVRAVQLIHRAAGFEFGKIMSNSRAVLTALGEKDTQDSKCLNLDEEVAPERVLGLVWAPWTDAFTFDKAAVRDVEDLNTSGTAPTKRQVLRIVMKLFDPLGSISHFTVHGKVLMQDVWRSGTDWDEPIPEHLRSKWQRWSKELEHLNEVNITRCYFGNTRSNEISKVQLHVFVDASESAYAAVAYLRTVAKEKVRCSFVAAKTKVAPLKPLSIPRLELQAAVLGARLAQCIGESLTLPIQKRVIWSDSMTVLAWLRSVDRRYHQFVSFRVGEILTLTSLDEWRHVPTRQNVADEATKWGIGPTFDPENRWYQGPLFLQLPEVQWPKEVGGATTTEEELHAVLVHRIEDELISIERFSSWKRLHRTAVYVHRGVAIICQRKVKKQVSCKLTSEDFQKAERMLWRQAQAQGFTKEMQDLKQGEKVVKTSSLYSLTPFLDEHGIIRVGGRIRRAPNVPFDARFPVILPKQHRTTWLLVDDYHRQFLHGNGETVCNEIRQRFHIPNLRALVKRVSRECQHCKVRKAKPAAPIMAELPKERVTAFVRPFTYVGVDYFGPLEVKVGRSLVKRWVCLFTCLTIRAIHLELTHSLSTQSCVMAFRRFVSRRGAPLEVFSDNGTNFIGASRQLAEEKQTVQRINEVCAATFTNAQTMWNFNVPAAPHMGGPWERMVRSVKTAMKAITENPRHPSDEVLETILIEAEGVVNSRPLTFVSLEKADQEALTPNHFLLYGSTGVNQPAVVHGTEGRSLRDSWNLAQNIMDEFWRRWIREYLPMLTRRTKWFEVTKPLAAGDLVIIVDDSTRNRWERGRILEVFPDKNGQVRRATVHTARGVLKRPAVKLAVLDVERK